MNTSSSIETPAGAILVIDDKAGPRESLRMLFKYGYEVWCADSVDAGIERLRKTTIDVIILDINMPVKSGIDGLREIRAIDASVSIIMLTGYGSLKTAQDAIRLGANDYITKPYDVTEMQELVDRSLKQTRLNRSREAIDIQLRVLNERLHDEVSRKESSEEINRRSAEFVHDLSNSLTVIYNYVLILRKDMTDLDSLAGEHLAKTVENMEMIERSIHRCCEITRAWKNLGKRRDETVHAIKLPAMFKQLIAELTPPGISRSGGAEFVLNMDDAVVLGNETQVYRAFFNIMDNAVRAVPKMGGRINISGNRRDDQFKIRICDNGKGIEGENFDQIFKPYFTTRNENSGTGLGLFITKQIIEAYGGSIAVESEVGTGTTFTIEFPLES